MAANNLDLHKVKKPWTNRRTCKALWYGEKLEMSGCKSETCLISGAKPRTQTKQWNATHKLIKSSTNGKNSKRAATIPPFRCSDLRGKWKRCFRRKLWSGRNFIKEHSCLVVTQETVSWTLLHIPYVAFCYVNLFFLERLQINTWLAEVQILSCQLLT
jgi:hypothetical protein